MTRPHQQVGGVCCFGWRVSTTSRGSLKLKIWKLWTDCAVHIHLKISQVLSTIKVEICLRKGGVWLGLLAKQKNTSVRKWLVVVVGLGPGGLGFPWSSYERDRYLRVALEYQTTGPPNPTINRWLTSGSLAHDFGCSLYSTHLQVWVGRESCQKLFWSRWWKANHSEELEVLKIF